LAQVIAICIAPQTRVATAMEGQAAQELLVFEGRQHEHQVWRLLGEVVRAAIPNIAALLLTLIPETMNMLSIGQVAVSEDAVAAIGLGNMVQNCFGLSIGIGLTGALDTLVSQATGAGQHELSIAYLQRSRVLVTLQLLWMVPLLWFSKEWLVVLRQHQEVSHLASQYNRAALLGLVGMLQFEANQVFLRNKGWLNGPTLVVAATTALHTLWCYIFIWYLRLGNEGAGWANTVTGCLQCLLSYGYLLWKAPAMGLPRWPLISLPAQAFHGWGHYMRIALPNTAVLCCDWWVSEVLTVIVGWLGPEAQAVHNSVFNIQALILLPIGLGMRFTAAFLVGSALGENKPQKAKHTVLLCVGLAGIYWAILALLIILFPNLVAALYFRAEALSSTRHLMERLLRIFAIAGTGQILQVVMAGALAGLGKQGIGAKVYLFSNWIVMLPLALLFGFGLGWGVEGVWYAILIGPTLSAFCLGLVLSRLGYVELAEAASGQHAVPGENQPEATTPGSATPATQRSLSSRQLVRSTSQGLSCMATMPGAKTL